MSPEGISLTRTSEQVEMVIADVAGREAARRYVYTLMAVDLLEQDPKIHKYRLAG